MTQPDASLLELLDQLLTGWDRAEHRNTGGYLLRLIDWQHPSEDYVRYVDDGAGGNASVLCARVRGIFIDPGLARSKADVVALLRFLVPEHAA